MSGRGAALVTGGARGIGRAIATALSGAGFAVAVADREPVDDDPGSLRLRADVADIDGHAALLREVEAALGPLACLVNNAGVTSLVRGDPLDLTPESFDRSVAVNLRGTFFLTQAVARRLLAGEAGGTTRSIVTISSANAEIVGLNRADYCMTKSALSMMSKVFAARLAAAGIVVAEIQPGIIRTEMTAPATEKYDAYIAGGGVPMARWGTPEDVAAAVVAVATGALPYWTGDALRVGGGLHLHRV